MELVVFQYMLIVLAQLLTVDSSTVCRHTKNTRVTKDVETMVTTWTTTSTVTTGTQIRQQPPTTPTAPVALSPATSLQSSTTTTYFFHHCRTSATCTLHFDRCFLVDESRLIPAMPLLDNSRHVAFTPSCREIQYNDLRRFLIVGKRNYSRFNVSKSEQSDGIRFSRRVVVDGIRDDSAGSMDPACVSLARSTAYQTVHWFSFSPGILRKWYGDDADRGRCCDAIRTRNVTDVGSSVGIFACGARGYPSLAVDHSMRRMHATALDMLE